MVDRRYHRIRVVGSGSYGCCYLVSYKGRQFIEKNIDLSQMVERDREETKTEIRVLQSLRHPYIIAYRDSYIKSHELSIVMDFADGGDLHGAIKKSRRTPFAETKVLKWFTQMCLALKHIHDKRVLHRDLKTQNIFLQKLENDPDAIKIGDFGIARVLSHTQEFANTRIGTPYYLSPEICLEKPYSYKTDVWSLGCVLFELITFKHPFNASSIRELCNRIMYADYAKLDANVSSFHRELIAQILQKDPRNRPSCEQLLQKPALQKQILKFHIPDAEKDRLAKLARPAHDGDCLPAGHAPPHAPKQEQSHAMRYLEERRIQHKEQISDGRKHKEAQMKSTYEALAAKEFFTNRALANRAREKVQAEEERSRSADIDEVVDHTRHEIDARRRRAMENLSKQREELERGKRKIREEMERESQRKINDYAVRHPVNSNLPPNERQGALRFEDRASLQARQGKGAARAIELDLERVILDEARLKKEQRRQSRMAYSAGLRGFIDAQRKMRKNEIEHSDQEDVLVVDKKDHDNAPPKTNVERFVAAERQWSKNGGKEAVGTEGWSQPPLSARYHSADREDDAPATRVPHTARGERDAGWNNNAWNKPTASISGERILFNKAPSAWLPPERDTANCDFTKNADAEVPVPSSEWEPPSTEWTPAPEIMEKPTRTVFASSRRAQASVSREGIRSASSSGESNSENSDKERVVGAPSRRVKATAPRAESKSASSSVRKGKEPLSPATVKERHTGSGDVRRAGSGTTLQTHVPVIEKPLSPDSPLRTDIVASTAGGRNVESSAGSPQNKTVTAGTSNAPCTTKSRNVVPSASSLPQNKTVTAGTSNAPCTTKSRNVAPSTSSLSQSNTDTAGTSNAPCTAESRNGVPSSIGLSQGNTATADTSKAPRAGAPIKRPTQEKGAAAVLNAPVDGCCIPISSSSQARGAGLVAPGGGMSEDSVLPTCQLKANAVVPRAARNRHSISLIKSSDTHPPAPSSLPGVEKKMPPAAVASCASQTTAASAGPIPRSVEVGQPVSSSPLHKASAAAKQIRPLTIEIKSPTVSQKRPTAISALCVESITPSHVSGDLENRNPVAVCLPKTHAVLNHTKDVRNNGPSAPAKLDVPSQNVVSSAGCLRQAMHAKNKPASMNNTPYNNSNNNNISSVSLFDPPRRNGSVDNWNRRNAYHGAPLTCEQVNNAPAAGEHKDRRFGRNQARENSNTPPPMSARTERPIFVTVDGPMTARYGYERHDTPVGDEWHSCPNAASSQRLIYRANSAQMAARFPTYNTKQQRPVVTPGYYRDENDDDVLRDFLQRRQNARLFCPETTATSRNTSVRPVPTVTTESWQSPVAAKHGNRLDDDAPEKTGSEWRSCISKSPKAMQIDYPIDPVTRINNPTLKTMQIENPIDPVTNVELRLFDARRDSTSFRIEQLRAHLEKKLGLTEFISAYRYLQDEDGHKGSWQNAKLKPLTERYLPLIHQLLRYEEEYYNA